MDSRFIAVDYKLYSIDEEGTRDFEEETQADRPFRFISGIGMTLEGFEGQLIELQPGANFDFTLKAEDAYGEYNDEHVVDLPKQIFEIDGKFDSKHIVPDTMVPLMTADGQRVNGIVVEVRDDVVVVDLNHPLAGCALNFMGKVVENRLATPEEISQAVKLLSGECGCGGSCGGSCGGGCEGGCGDGCEGGCEGGCK